RIAVFSLMLLWLVFLFAFVGICASEFFCPNLSHISSRLGLSESVAGVTFLAFSNGSPDVFSTFSALRSNSGSLAIGELLGAASFITSVVAGTMALITPFRVQRRTFLRDVGFFTVAVTLTLCILYDQHIHLWEALLMVGLYVIYVLFVAVGSWWENRQADKKRQIREARGEYEDEDLDNMSLIGKVTALLCVPALLALNLTLPVAEEPPCDDDYPLEPLNLGSPAVALQQNPLEEFGVVQSSEAAEEASRRELHSEAVIEQEAMAREHVTRTLTAMQCALGPVFVVTALLADELIWWYPLAAFAVGLFFAFLAYRFFTDTRHRGRIILSFLGFGIAMVWILMIVNEVVGRNSADWPLCVQTLGHIFGISDAILGLTIFAMGNSLGDLVANATVARMGYPAMAVAACFGGPMLNILLGVGLSGTYLILLGPARGQPIHVAMGRTLSVSGFGLLAILLATLIFVPLNGYRMSKRVGATLIVAY
ncbi:hypothetical protein RHOSPDRAFT_11990, partial [Rhodotorula sp. JG-1b]